MNLAKWLQTIVATSTTELTLYYIPGSLGSVRWCFIKNAPRFASLGAVARWVNLLLEESPPSPTQQLEIDHLLQQWESPPQSQSQSQSATSTSTSTSTSINLTNFSAVKLLQTMNTKLEIKKVSERNTASET